MGSIAALFPSPVIVKLLSVFFTHQHHLFYQRDLAKRSGYSLTQVQYALGRIVESGLVKKWNEGNRTYYSANTNHPAFDDLKNAFKKTVSLGDFCKTLLEENKEQIQIAFIFGSMAKGDEDPESDVDLFILGDISLKEIAPTIDALGKHLERVMDPILYTGQKLKSQLQENNRFAQELVTTPKIWLIGNEDEFRKLAS